MEILINVSGSINILFHCATSTTKCFMPALLWLHFPIITSMCVWVDIVTNIWTCSYVIAFNLQNELLSENISIMFRINQYIRLDKLKLYVFHQFNYVFSYLVYSLSEAVPPNFTCLLKHSNKNRVILGKCLSTIIT